jgi:hypothetical protein
MPVTVQEALTLDIFSRCHLLTGDSGLHNDIYWVNILEILDDLSHIESGEFLITTAHGLKNLSETRQREIIELFASRKMAAMAVQIGFYIDEIPDLMIDLFRKSKIPLIEIPTDISFKSITRSLMLALLQAEKADDDSIFSFNSKLPNQQKYTAVKNLWQKIADGSNSGTLQQKLHDLNLRKDQDFWLCRIAAFEDETDCAQSLTKVKTHLVESIGQALFQIMEQRFIPYLIGETASNVILLLQPTPESAAAGNTISHYTRRIIEELRVLFPQLKIYLGLSNRQSGLGSWKKALDQAEKALQIAVLKLQSHKSFVSYAALGPLKLILAVDNIDTLSNQIDDTLKPLFDYDKKTDGALIHTLRVYLQYLNIKSAAEELYIHRHTMKYRLNQIKKLTGYNPEEASAVVQMSEALLIYDYLKARGLYNYTV